MRVLFYEPDPTGHHFAYLGRMLPGFLRLPIHVELATTEAALESREFALSLSPYRDGLTIHTECVRAQGSATGRGWHRFREFVRVTRKLAPDHVCVMYGHGIWQFWAILARFGSRPIPRRTTAEMWVYRGRFSYPDSRSAGARMKRFLFRGLLRSGQLAVVHPVDDLLYEYAQRAAQGRTAIQLSPDPITYVEMIEKQAARAELGLPTTGRMASCTGMIDRRKGCDLAIRAFTKHVQNGGSHAKDDRLLLAGPHDDNIQRQLRARDCRALLERGQIISRNEFLDERGMFLVASASDLVLAPYPDHSGRSSIILWAAAAGRPVLAVNRGCIEHVVRTEKLGKTCTVSDIDGFSRAMAASFDMRWDAADVARVRGYAKWHRIENYQDLASNYVRSRVEGSSRGSVPA